MPLESPQFEQEGPFSEDVVEAAEKVEKPELSSEFENLPKTDKKTKKNTDKEKSVRTSGIEKVIGSTPENREAVERHWRELFDKPPRWLHELPKTPEAIMLIESIASHFPEFIEGYGGRQLQFKPEHVHLFDARNMPEDYHKNVFMKDSPEGTRKRKGFYKYDLQGVAVLLSQHGGPIDLAKVLVHELTHFASYQSVDLRIDEQKKSGTHKGRRGGLSIGSEKSEAGFFTGVNEAVTEELAGRFLNRYFSAIPFVGEEIRHFVMEQINSSKDPEQVMRAYENYIQLRKDSENDATAVHEAKEQFASIVEELGLDLSLFQIPFTEYLNLHGGQPYYSERMHLNQIINEIYEKNRADFTESEEVFEVFARASFSGRLLPLARLVEKTYGKGSFRDTLESI